jgi:hypothetical protein
MAKDSLNIVRHSLQSYADRGVFRGFSETPKGRFRFCWLVRQEMELRVDTAKHALRFTRVLPDIPVKSALYRELKEFIANRHGSDLPEHRRIDRKRAEASLSNRSGFVSITVKVRKNDYEYGVNRIVNLVHELFLHLKNSHPEYLVESFDVPQE